MGNYTIDLGVTALEAKKTADMILQAAQTLAKSFKLVKRRRFREAAQALGISTPKGAKPSRSPTNNWMEYRYGWRTMVMDIDGAMRQLADFMISKPPILVVKSQVKDAWGSTATISRAGSIAAAATPVYCDILQSYSYECGASITYRFSVSNSFLSTATQMGLTNPLTWAWEIIPYSFVVDWFCNVGDVLQNMTAFHGKTYIDGTQCRWIGMRASKLATSFTSEASYKYETVSSAGGQTSYDFRSFERTRIPFTGPSLRLQAKINPFKVVDAAAMLRQILSK